MNPVASGVLEREVLRHYGLQQPADEADAYELARVPSASQAMARAHTETVLGCRFVRRQDGLA